MFLAFLLTNALRTTTACNFRHLNFQKWSKREVLLAFWISKCASRHNGVQFFISHLASWLRTRCISEVTFGPSGAPNSWKQHSESWLSYLFVDLHILAFHSVSSLIFSLIDFSSLTIPTSAFSSLHIVGNLTSKLPSIILYSYVPASCNRTL